jgi:hypothetical protein
MQRSLKRTKRSRRVFRYNLSQPDFRNLLFSTIHQPSFISDLLYSSTQQNKLNNRLATYLSNHSYSPSTVPEGPFISTEGWRLVMASMTRCTYAIPTSTRRTCITFLTDRAPQLMATLATASIHPGRSHVCMDINTNTKLRLLIESTNLYLASCTKMLASPPSSTYIYG